MAEPSIKGTAFDSVLQDVRALLERRRLTRAALAKRLRPEHAALLDEKVSPAGWYPIGCYAALLEVLCEIEGAGRPKDYLFRRGALTAERLHAAGIYPQLDASGEKLGVRVLPIVVSMAGSIYNFTRWSSEVDPSNTAFRIVVDEAADYPDVARFAAEGFLHCTTERIVGCRAEVASERPTPDRVVFQAKIEHPWPPRPAAA